MLTISVAFSGCDWSVKDNDNESNSQPPSCRIILKFCCDWSVKDNDNESNSQQCSTTRESCPCCDWSVKDNDNESNSQPLSRRRTSPMRCDWSVKDNDNESNTQALTGCAILVTFTWPANLSQKALWGIWGIPMERNCVHLHRLPALQSRRTIGWVCR